MICIESIQTEGDASLIVEEYVFPESPYLAAFPTEEEPVPTAEESVPTGELIPTGEESVEESVHTVEEPVPTGEEPVEESVPTVEEPVPTVEEPVILTNKPINRHRKPWSNSEVARLYREYQINRYTIDQIAEMHGRTYYSIVGKLKKENILYDVEEEEETYLQEEEDEDENQLPLTVQLNTPFLKFARAYCYAVEYVADTIFSAASRLYNAVLMSRR